MRKETRFKAVKSRVSEERTKKCSECKGTGAHQKCGGAGCKECEWSGECTVCDGWGYVEEGDKDDDDDDDD